MIAPRTPQAIHVIVHKRQPDQAAGNIRHTGLLRSALSCIAALLGRSSLVRMKNLSEFYMDAQGHTFLPLIAI